MAQLDSSSETFDEYLKPVKTNLLNQRVPEDNLFLQTNQENKFIGTLIWKFLDFISLGQLESSTEKNKQKDNKANSTKKSNDTSSDTSKTNDKSKSDDNQKS